jgi:hypothetical protein
MKMRILPVIILLFCAAHFSFGQVGINTINPTADLEIVAKEILNTGEYNGVIVPRVTVLPVTGDTDFPTDAQRGLLLYLDSDDAEEGIYSFDGTQYVRIVASASGAFFDNGTTDFATTTTTDVQRQGNVSIGSALNSGKLNVDVVSANNSEDPIGIKVENNNTGTGSTDTYAIFSENNSNVGGTGIKYGMRSDVSSSGNSDRVGILNDVKSSSASTIRGVIGIDNLIGATSGASSTNIGIRSQIGTPASDANSIGILSIARGDDGRDNYSGYFQGDKFAIRNEDDSDGYELPTTDGTSGQVLTTNGAGVAAWQPVGGSKALVRGHLSGPDNFGMSDNPDLSGTNYRLIDFTEDFDVDNNFDPATHLFTAPRDGYYKINATYHSLEEDNRGAYGIAIVLDASTIKTYNEYHHSGDLGGGQSKVERSVSDVVYLNQNQTVSIYGKYDDTTNFLLGQSAFTYFTIEEL